MLSATPASRKVIMQTNALKNQKQVAVLVISTFMTRKKEEELERVSC